jgi:hypothetical protein
MTLDPDDVARLQVAVDTGRLPRDLGIKVARMLEQANRPALFACPRCGNHLTTAADEIGELIVAMRRWCADNDRWISFDGRVNEAEAAELIGRDPATLRNWRASNASPVPFVRSGSGRGRVTYLLLDLATHLLRSR